VNVTVDVSRPWAHRVPHILPKRCVHQLDDTPFRAPEPQVRDPCSLILTLASVCPDRGPKQAGNAVSPEDGPPHLQAKTTVVSSHIRSGMWYQRHMIVHVYDPIDTSICVSEREKWGCSDEKPGIYREEKSGCVSERSINTMGLSYRKFMSVKRFVRDSDCETLRRLF
jgi:hypothetical protein